MQDEINEKIIGISVKGVKLTAELVQKAIKKLLEELEKTGQELTKTPTVKRGEQTLKQLAAQNAGLSSIELTDPKLRLLRRELNKDGVDFSPVKTGKGQYVLVFKGRDADAITHAFNQYTAKVVKQAERPSIRKLLSNMKEAAAQKNAERGKVKNKDKEQSL